VIGRQRSGVFLSYARKDGEAFAATLRERLHAQAPDIEVKQDRLLLEGGVGWWKQLTDAIDSVEFLVLVMTPSSMRSETVRKEWRYARQQGVCVYPVKGAQDLHFSELPRWMSKAHFFDLDKEWEGFVAHLRKGCDAPRVPFMAPDLPENFVERPEEFGRLKSLLLSTDRKGPVAITTALSGAGGFGKTTLAIALCHDEDIVQNFDDGILWVTLGQNPNVMSALITAYAALTGERPGFASEEDATFQLGQKLEDRTCLLVIDDVWDDGHLRAFLRGGKGSARLFTTRMAAIASGAHSVNVDEMRSEEASTLLIKGVPGLDAAQAERQSYEAEVPKPGTAATQLSVRLGEWPIALELAAAMMRQRIAQGDSAEHAAQRLLEILDKKGPWGLASETGNKRHRTIESVLESSLELLTSEIRARLTELTIFPEDVAIPLSAAAALWGLDEWEAEETAQKFARLFLLKLDLARGSMRLHDVIQRWLAAGVPDTVHLHGRLVDAWPHWMHLPDSYAWRWLTWHLARANRHADIAKILWDPAWLQAKLRATDINALIADFEYLKSDREAELVQGALRLSSHVLAKDPSQFTSQIVGRLLPHEQQANIRQLCASLVETAEHTWLRLLRPTLDPPGTALLRTLVGHSNFVTAVALTPGGEQAVSASLDNTLKVWDLETGQELRTLIGHSSWVHGVAISPDGRRVISASEDGTLKLWDFDSGHELHTLSGHVNAVNATAVTSEGRFAVSASSDKTLKVWDLVSGKEIRTLAGHTDSVNAVSISPDNLHVISASSDGTLKVWNLETGEQLRDLIGHSGAVTGIAMITGGSRVVSASSDKTLKVWNLETGQELHTLTGHSAELEGLATTPDGCRALSASRDRTVKVWDLETGLELSTFAGHVSWVSAVSVSLGSALAISASWDKTLKVWDLDARQEQRTRAVHSGEVYDVKATRAGDLAVSASSDKTLKVWDLETGQELCTLAGHHAGVRSVAVTPDGLFAISASDDSTVRLWDLRTGQEQARFNHSTGARNVAMSADGRRAVSVGFDALIVWNLGDLKRGRRLQTIEGYSGWTSTIAISPNADCALSALHSSIRVLNLDSGREERTLEGHSDRVTSIAVSYDGNRAISASRDRRFKLWELETGKLLRDLTGHSDAITSVALSPDGQRIVAASDDNMLKVWDLMTGTNIATFTCDSVTRCCAFAGNRTIVAGDSGGRVHFLALEFPQSH
jgi:WD40 repeat protein